MGTITVNVKDNVEEKFRTAVKEEVGVGKGKLGQAFTEAMLSWLEEKRQEVLKQRALIRLKKGFTMGKILYKKREELYER